MLLLRATMLGILVGGVAGIITWLITGGETLMLPAAVAVAPPILLVTIVFATYDVHVPRRHSRRSKKPTPVEQANPAEEATQAEASDEHAHTSP